MSVLHPATRETRAAPQRHHHLRAGFSRFPSTIGCNTPMGSASFPPRPSGPRSPSSAGGIAGVTAAYELMKLGLKPVLYEAGRLGGRLRSEPFEGDSGIIAELGGMRFPSSSVCFYHYLDLVGLSTQAFPQPARSRDTEHASRSRGRPGLCRSRSDAAALCCAKSPMRGATRSRRTLISAPSRQPYAPRDVPALKALWNRLVPLWDERTFYDFVATSKAFQKYPFRHREIFGQVGFRHRRLGQRLSELHAGDPACRTHQTSTRTSGSWSAARGAVARAGCGRTRPSAACIGRLARR